MTKHINTRGWNLTISTVAPGPDRASKEMPGKHLRDWMGNMIMDFL